MELATLQGTITWEAKDSASTIDLAFISQLLQQRLIECTTHQSLNHSSDHLPVSLQFELCPTRTQPQLARAWKKADLALIAVTTTQELLLPGNLTTLDQIDIYSDYLVNFT